MTLRSIWILGVVLAAVAMAGCPSAGTPEPSEIPTSNNQADPPKPKRPTGVVGYYIHDDPVFYGAKDMSSVPPGQVMHLGIKERHWMKRNMLTAYGGTCVQDKVGAILAVNEGPTGKTNGKERITAKRTDSGITLSLKQSPDQHSTSKVSPSLRFKYVGLAAPTDFGYEEFLEQRK